MHNECNWKPFFTVMGMGGNGGGGGERISSTELLLRRFSSIDCAKFKYCFTTFFDPELLFAEAGIFFCLGAQTDSIGRLPTKANVAEQKQKRRRS